MIRNFIARLAGRPHRRGVIRVWCKWDDEAHVWYVAKSELPGIAAEAESLEELGKAVVLMAEDLMEEESNGDLGRTIPIELLSRFPSHAHS